MVLSLSLEIYNISVLDLKPHWVIYHSRFHGGCGVQVLQERDWVWMRVLGAVLRGDRDASPLPFVSRVVD
jgi:hypothetical protein